MDRYHHPAAFYQINARRFIEEGASNMQFLIAPSFHPVEAIERELFTRHGLGNLRSSLLYPSPMRSYHHNIGIAINQLAPVSTTFLLGSRQFRKASVLVCHTLLSLSAPRPQYIGFDSGGTLFDDHCGDQMGHIYISIHTTPTNPQAPHISSTIRFVRYPLNSSSPFRRTTEKN